MAAWLKTDTGSDFGSSYIKIIQGPSEPYVDFIGRLKDAIEKQIKRRKKSQLAFENASEDHQGVIRPWRKKGNVMDFLKLCSSVGTYQHRANCLFRNLCCPKTDVCKVFLLCQPGHLKKLCKFPLQQMNVQN